MGAWLCILASLVSLIKGDQKSINIAAAFILGAGANFYVSSAGALENGDDYYNGYRK